MSRSTIRVLMTKKGVGVNRTIHYENWLTEGEVDLQLITNGDRRVITVNLRDAQGRSLTGECLRAARILTRTVRNITSLDVPETDTEGGTTWFNIKLKDGITSQEAEDVHRLFTKLWGDDLNARQRSRADIRKWFTETPSNA